MLCCYLGCAGMELPVKFSSHCAAWRQAGSELLLFPFGADSPKALLTAGALGSVSC